MKQLIVTGIAVIVAIVVLSLIAGGLDDQRDEIQTGWSWMLRLIGSVFIIAPAVVLVMIAIRGEERSGIGGSVDGAERPSLPQTGKCRGPPSRLLLRSLRRSRAPGIRDGACSPKSENAG